MKACRMNPSSIYSYLHVSFSLSKSTVFFYGNCGDFFATDPDEFWPGQIETSPPPNPFVFGIGGLAYFTLLSNFIKYTPLL